MEGLGFPESLRQRFEQDLRPGNFIDPSGKVLGPHEGFHRYTIGQRRGLGIALGVRAHVVGLRAEDASVILSTEDSDLLCAGLRASGLHWYAPPPRRCEAQIRSRHPGAAARLELQEDGTALVHFEKSQSAVTPGQAVAFYEGQRLVGGGWIDAAIPGA